MTVYFSHATSFCGAVWNPVIDYFDDVDTVAWDHPGHGSGPPIELPIDWTLFGEYVLDVTKPGGIGVGHSMGAVALAMAQIADPQRFGALILIEPIMFPGPYERRDDSMSEVARRRRRWFGSRVEAADNFRGRGAFAGWDHAAFDGYIRCGLVGDDHVVLACDPEVEADIYRASRAHDTWERVGSVEVPVLLMTGEGSDTITPEFAREQAARFPRAGVEIVSGAGHFLPMERPGLVADRVRRLLETVGSG
ncbi:MAG TPA: alpha/beta hydrolase [Acidimicrobiia bacterium]|nr:alpha/beta hydrolase [Acidimicrobiia bacterium]